MPLLVLRQASRERSRPNISFCVKVQEIPAVVSKPRDYLKVLEQLIEEARDLYDWIALLWAAFGEAPAKEWLANVNYRRALLLFQTARTCFGQEWRSSESGS